MIRVFFLSMVAFLLTIFNSLAQQNPAPDAGSPDSTVQNTSHYVIFNKDTLFAVEANLGPYTAAERAAAIGGRLKNIVSEYRVESELFGISEKNNYSIISYDDYPIMSISEADAAILGKPREELASEYLAIIKEAFSEVIERNTVTYWLLRAAYTLLALAGLILIFFLVNKLFKWINHKLAEYEKGLKRKRRSIFKYLIPTKTNNIFLVISRVVKFALIVFILFIYLPFLFSFLPWTKGLAEKFYGYLADPVKKIVNQFIDFIPNLFSIFVILIIARYLLKILSLVARELESEKLKIKGFHSDWAKPTFNLVKIVIYILTAVFVVQYLPSSKAFQGVSIFVGVLFTLGSTSAIANIVAGIVITYMRPFQIGDRVKIGETIGDVVEKNLLVTRLKTVKNEDVTIPNATIINTHLWNYSKNASSIGILLHTSVTIGYDVPSETVVDLLLEAAKNTPNLTREFKPFVLQKSLNDFYVEYELNVYTKQPNKMAHFYSEIHKNILDAFNRANVEILSPHYAAHRDGSESTIPKTEGAPKDPVAKDPVKKVIDKITGQDKK